MINDVLKEIEQAEAKADEIAKQAMRRAESLRLGAAAKVEEIKKEYDMRLKESLAKIEADAEKEADEKAAAMRKEIQIEAAAVAKVNERAFAKCVEAVAEKISKI